MKATSPIGIAKTGGWQAMQTEELKMLIKEVLKDSPEPLSPEDIAARILKGWPNLVPHPLYNPARIYRPGQRVYHASREQWFIVQEVKEQVLIAKLKDGKQEKFTHNRSEHQVLFPVTPEAYLVKWIKLLLPGIPGLYQQDSLWYVIERPVIKRPIERVCQEYQIRYFYHITHIQNLAGILTQGVLCKNKLAPGSYCDISEPESQEHRRTKHLSQYPKLTLHDRVPLFFAPKPPMLSARREQQREIIYLHIHPDVLALPRVVFTDGNARSNKTKFYNRLEDLKHLDWKILWAEYWGVLDDPEQHNENKRRRAAEVLVPDCVPVSYIQRITVMGYNTYHQAVKIVHEARLAQDIPIYVDPSMYF